MKYLLNTIDSKLNTLDLNIEDVLYDELLLILQQIKVDFRKNNNEDFEKYIDKLNELQNLRNSISTHLNSYDFDTEKNQDDVSHEKKDSGKKNKPNKNKKRPSKKTEEDYEDDDKVNALSVSSNVLEEITQENFDKRLSRMSGMTDNTYYFYRFNKDYGEQQNKLTLSYNLKSIDEFDLFSIKISGIKLFDNVFFGRTINESMSKMFSFLFMLNETPFISLCSKNTKYFAKSTNTMKRPITLKDNECYFESNLDENEASEMLKIFLEHINVDTSACKILLDCTTNKTNESFITFIL